MKYLFLNQLSEFVLIHGLAVLLGLLVINYDFKVNYTRKIFHFFVFFSPYLLKALFPFEESLTTQVSIACVGISTLGIYTKPIRNNVKLVSLMFCAFDRPEDKPFTLKWLFLQYLTTYIVALPLWLGFKKYGHTEAITMIILINAIGDGLAEPVGITWGKHKYKVKALFTSKVYTRSIEGSACVFITAILVILIFKNSFTVPQFWTALLAVPTVATIAEAKSPHTFDSPFIFLFTGLALWTIYLL